MSAGDFCWRLVPGMPPVAFLTLTKYPQAQSILTLTLTLTPTLNPNPNHKCLQAQAIAPSVAIALVANLLNAAFNWLLIPALLRWPPTTTPRPALPSHYLKGPPGGARHHPNPNPALPSLTRPNPNLTLTPP